jgi:hypothetical protein
MRISLIAVAFCAASTQAAAQATAPDRSPVALHAGIAYAGIADAEFETVQTLAGQELFSQATARTSRTDFGAFVSHRLWSGAEDIGAYATLGTNVNRPGDVLYLGGSIALSRAMVTAGAATGLVERGSAPARDEVFRGSGDRELFASLSSVREWAFFAAVSVALVK